jgi:tRNA A37 threonylcarbamoyladenosine dehydratase
LIQRAGLLLQTQDTDRRFSGLSRLYGDDMAQRIRRAHVVVVGIGGVGSWAAEALARSGVGQLTLIDMDHVSESNINRQLHALSTTLGQSKVLAMAQRIGLINADCHVNQVDDFISPDNIDALISEDLDVLIDATDEVSAKVALATWAIQHHKAMVTVGAAGGKKQAHLVEMNDLTHATHDPLLAQVRYRLRKNGVIASDKNPCGIQAVFSKEPIVRPAVATGDSCNSDLNCHGYGSLVTVTATFGHCAAGWGLNHFSH